MCDYIYSLYFEYKEYIEYKIYNIESITLFFLIHINYYLNLFSFYI